MAKKTRSQETDTCMIGTEERRPWSWKCEEAREELEQGSSCECEHLITLDSAIAVILSDDDLWYRWYLSDLWYR